MPLNIIYGGPGSGKTTAIQGLSALIDFEYISVGEIYRKEIKSLSPIGIELSRYTNANLKYPDALIEKMMKGVFDRIDTAKVLVLDGFPKYENELAIFKRLLCNTTNKTTIGSAIILNINQEAALERISCRSVCSKCDFQTRQQGKCPRCGSHDMILRKDDNIISFKERFRLFLDNCNSIVNGLDKIGFQIVEIDACQDEETIRSIIEKYIKPETNEK